MQFRDHLRNILRQEKKFPQELIDVLPSGFQQLESKVILKIDSKLGPYEQLIAEAIHQILPQVTSIWIRGGEIEGKYRQPGGLRHIWGDTNSEVIINENNIRYKFDFTRIMFAKGNVNERGLLPKKVQSGEIIVDMFAGIGYFTLGMAKTRKPQRIYALEWNPEAFKYLQENLKLNHIEDIVLPIFGDCKESVPKLANQGIQADRVIMGLLPAPIDAIPAALMLIKNSGTIVIYEGIESKESIQLFNEFTEIAEKTGFHTKLLERRIVKNYKPHQYHVVVEILVTKH